MKSHFMVETVERGRKSWKRMRCIYTRAKKEWRSGMERIENDKNA